MQCPNGVFNLIEESPCFFLAFLLSYFNEGSFLLMVTERHGIAAILPRPHICATELVRRSSIGAALL
jgi:hypothetical protein